MKDAEQGQDPKVERKEQAKTRKDALKSLRRTNRMQAVAHRAMRKR